MLADRALTDEIGRGIMRVRRVILSEAGRGLEAQGQAVLTWQVLNYLDRCGPAAQTALAEGLGQHAPGISRLVETLAADKLVKRGRSRQDRRLVIVGLARRGKARLEAGRPLVEAAVERVLAPLDLADRRALRNLLWKIAPQK